MPTPSRRLVCVHSLTAHGIVGLKPFLTALGETCLPVPSVILSGPGNMPGVQRQTTALDRLLDSTLAALAAQNTRADLFVGYLADAAQVDAVETLIATHRAVLDHVIIDPVCGDDGRAYVAADLVAAWPRLLRRADWALPNLTEAALLAGVPESHAVAALRAQLPGAGVVVTGIPAGEAVETQCYPAGADEPTVHRQARIGGRADGTGDHFAAVWWREHRQRGADPAEAVAHAAAAVAACLKDR